MYLRSANLPLNVVCLFVDDDDAIVFLARRRTNTSLDNNNNNNIMYNGTLSERVAHLAEADDDNINVVGGPKRDVFKLNTHNNNNNIILLCRK